MAYTFIQSCIHLHIYRVSYIELYIEFLCRRTLDIEPDIEFCNEVGGFHYTLTPYKFLPMKSYKMNPEMSIDLSQGIVDVLNELE